MKYKCDVCGKKHNYYFGLEVPLHSGMLNSTTLEPIEEERISSFKNVRIVDNTSIYLNAPIHIRVNDLEIHLRWSVWGEVEFDSFRSFAEKVKINGYGQVPIQLDTRLITYIDTDETVPMIYDLDVDGSISFLFTKENLQYYNYQKFGIGSQELQQLMNKFYHTNLK